MNNLNFLNTYKGLLNESSIEADDLVIDGTNILLKLNEVETGLNQEIIDRQTGDSQEASARTQADEILQENIDTEVSDRTDADTALDNRLNVIEGKLYRDINDNENLDLKAGLGRTSQIKLYEYNPSNNSLYGFNLNYDGTPNEFLINSHEAGTDTERIKIPRTTGSKIKISNSGLSTSKLLRLDDSNNLTSSIYDDSNITTNINNISDLETLTQDITRTSTLLTLNNNFSINKSTTGDDVVLKVSSGINGIAKQLFIENDDAYGFSIFYKGDTNTFHIARRNGSTTDVDCIKINRSNGLIELYGEVKANNAFKILNETIDKILYLDSNNQVKSSTYSVSDISNIINNIDDLETATTDITYSSNTTTINNYLNVNLNHNNWTGTRTIQHGTPSAHLGIIFDSVSTTDYKRFDMYNEGKYFKMGYNGSAKRLIFDFDNDILLWDSINIENLNTRLLTTEGDIDTLKTLTQDLSRTTSNVEITDNNISIYQSNSSNPVILDFKRGNANWGQDSSVDYRLMNAGGSFYIQQGFNGVIQNIFTIAEGDGSIILPVLSGSKLLKLNSSNVLTDSLYDDADITTVINNTSNNTDNIGIIASRLLTAENNISSNDADISDLDTRLTTTETKLTGITYDNNNSIDTTDISNNLQTEIIMIDPPAGHTRLYATDLSKSWTYQYHNTYHGGIGPKSEFGLPECGNIYTNASSTGQLKWAMYQGLYKDVATTSSTSLRMDWGIAYNVHTPNDENNTQSFNRKLTLRAGGQVGIGITPSLSDTYKLRVAGQTIIDGGLRLLNKTSSRLLYIDSNNDVQSSLYNESDITALKAVVVNARNLKLYTSQTNADLYIDMIRGNSTFGGDVYTDFRIITDASEQALKIIGARSDIGQQEILKLGTSSATIKKLLYLNDDCRLAGDMIHSNANNYTMRRYHPSTTTTDYTANRVYFEVKTNTSTYTKRFFIRAHNETNTSKVYFHESIYVNGSVFTPSDERIKTNIIDYPHSSLDILNKIEIKQYDYKYKSGSSIGVISQQVKRDVDDVYEYSNLTEIQPDDCEVDTEGTTIENLVAIKKDKLIFHCIKAIQELTEQNKQLLQRIEMLERAEG